MTEGGKFKNPVPNDMLAEIQTMVDGQQRKNALNRMFLQSDEESSDLQTDGESATELAKKIFQTEFDSPQQFLDILAQASQDPLVAAMIEVCREDFDKGREAAEDLGAVYPKVGSTVSDIVADGPRSPGDREIKGPDTMPG